MKLYALETTGENGLDDKPMKLYYDFTFHEWKVFTYYRVMTQLHSNLHDVQHWQAYVKEREGIEARIVEFTLSLQEE